MSRKKKILIEPNEAYRFPKGCNLLVLVPEHIRKMDGGPPIRGIVKQYLSPNPITKTPVVMSEIEGGGLYCWWNDDCSAVGFSFSKNPADQEKYGRLTHLRLEDAGDITIINGGQS